MSVLQRLPSTRRPIDLTRSSAAGERNSIARRVLTQPTEALAHSKLKELKRLRRTLMSWREEILAYFETGLTNARTEGFNNVAKLGKKLTDVGRLKFADSSS